MGQDPEVPQRVRFGAFEADLVNRELRRQGLKVKLNEKPFLLFSSSVRGKWFVEKTCARGFGLPIPTSISTLI